ncbi:hypothetical protein ACRAWG_08065 [Methylobacterium sp. P31]
MSTSDKPDGIRPSRRAFEPEVPPVLRRGRKHRIVRWIGAGQRRTSQPVEDSPSAAPETSVIRLSWADTFGRPVRPVPAGLGRSAATSAQVLPFRSRSTGDKKRPAQRREAGQPPVPVLR